MNNLSFMKNLLDGYHIEWKALGEIAGYSQTRVNATELDADSFVGVDNLVANKGGRISASYLPNTARLTAYELEDILIGNIRPYLKKVWKATNSGGCSGDVLAVRILDKYKQTINSQFLYYLLSSDMFFSYNMQHAKGAKMPRGNKVAIMKYMLPIPCPNNPVKSLKIQSEIVRILDTFTGLTTVLTTELTTELTLRKKQYNYYRDQLLSFKEGEVEWKTLGEALVRTKGTKITAGKMKELHKDGAPLKIFAGGQTTAFVNYEDIPLKNINREPSIIVKSRGNIEFEYYDKPFSHKNEMWSYHSKDVNINIKFIYYFLKTKEFYFQNIASKMQMPQIATPDTEKYSVPIPPIEKQNRIVVILDKFDILTNSISEDLPYELELRQKQYEYYRDLLLSFPKPGSDEDGSSL